MSSISSSSSSVDLSVVDFEYIDKLEVKDIKLLNKIIQQLQEEHFPQLLQHAKQKLQSLDKKYNTDNTTTTQQQTQQQKQQVEEEIVSFIHEAKVK